MAFGQVGGCVVRDRSFSGSIALLALVGKTSVNVFEGSTPAPAGSRLYLSYADGTRERLPLTFVGRPIRAAFFGRTIPPARRTAEARPTVLELWLRGKLHARRRLPSGVPAAPA